MVIYYLEIDVRRSEEAKKLPNFDQELGSKHRGENIPSYDFANLKPGKVFSYLVKRVSHSRGKPGLSLSIRGLR